MRIKALRVLGVADRKARRISGFGCVAAQDAHANRVESARPQVGRHVLTQ